MKKFLDYGENKIHYSRFGNGEKLLFAIPGFADDAVMFDVLKTSLEDQFTVIAINLPFHGETAWNMKTIFRKEDLKNIIQLFLRQENKNRFSLMGYSLGGKMVLSQLEFFSKQVESVFLFAPDGIVSSGFYNLAVYPKWGRGIFSFTVKYPRWFFLLLKILHEVRIVSEPLYVFTISQMNTFEKRQRIKNVWLVLREVKIEIKKVIKILNEEKIPLLLVYGKYDAVIKSKDGKNFAEKIKAITFVELDKGHRLVKEYLNKPVQLFIEENKL